VITDGVMPSMSGARLARELRAIRPDLPVALLSGSAEATEAARLEGIAVRIAKPLTVAELGAAVRGLLDRPT